MSAKGLKWCPWNSTKRWNWGDHNNNSSKATTTTATPLSMTFVFCAIFLSYITNQFCAHPNGNAWLMSLGIKQTVTSRIGDLSSVCNICGSLAVLICSLILLSITSHNSYSESIQLHQMLIDFAIVAITNLHCNILMVFMNRYIFCPI